MARATTHTLRETERHRAGPVLICTPDGLLPILPVLSGHQWVATGYTLALATVIPLTGRAADRFGTKWL